MGPLSDPELDGWLTALGLPAASTPATTSLALLGQSTAPVVGLVGWKLVAAMALSLGAGFGGGVLSRLHLEDRSPGIAAPVREMARAADPPFAPPTVPKASLPLPDGTVGGALPWPHAARPDAPAPIPEARQAALAPPDTLPTEPPRSLSGERELPDSYAEISARTGPTLDAAPRVRMVASANTLGARGGGVSGGLDPMVLGALTVSGRTGASLGSSAFLSGTLDAGAVIEPGGPRFTAGLTGTAGYSRELGSRRLDLGWALSGRLRADPARTPLHTGLQGLPSGESLSTGPALALSLGQADGPRLRLGLTAMVPLGEPRTPTLGLSIGADIAPWG